MENVHEPLMKQKVHDAFWGPGVPERTAQLGQKKEVQGSENGGSQASSTHGMYMYM